MRSNGASDQARVARVRSRHFLTLVAVGVLLVGCGASDDDGGPVVASDDGAASAASDGTTGSNSPDSFDDADAPSGKPRVELPTELPTELVVTDLIEGSGPAAEVGDTVTVNYVGVRSEDGVEFDNSYDRGSPFPLTLGVSSVIQGWQDGLIGVQTGTRRQLDIPADLAYGDRGSGDIIRPADAITFVIDVVSVEKPPVVTAPPMADPADCPAIDGSSPKQQTFAEMQPFCIDVTKSYSATVVTNFGEFTIEFDAEGAPQNVNNFVTLARYHYFDDTMCHRVLTDFVVQCGDPDASGYGGPGYTIPDELPLAGEYQLGSIAMANIGQPDTAGSQFFIISGERGAALPPQYSLIGQVSEGFDPVITKLNTLENPNGENGTPPLETITIVSVTITES
jgi:cyclophilin family peptidyl-prolyl cis-trans isomerase/FKBP-type peptidyl-prolyl cis-trans isomerase